MPPSIPFNNLKPSHKLIAAEVSGAVERVIKRGWFILGPEVEAFEAEFAAYHRVPHAVGVANGTDALELSLRAAGIGPGDEVITVSHTAVATVCAIERAGATPVLVDIDPQTYTMDPGAAEAAITSRTQAIIPVHLYGHPAALQPLVELTRRHHLLLVEDCAQAHGARYYDKLIGTYGDVAAFSFYPTKNLGAYGDGGAIITKQADYAERLRRLRTYGQTDRYRHIERGINSRLDEMQAAILRVKLQHLDPSNDERRRLAALYDSKLSHVSCPTQQPGAYHVYHLYVIRTSRRDALREHLQQREIGSLIHYPVPVHSQPAYQDLEVDSLPITEQIVDEILSLPLYIGLTDHEIDTICRAIREFSDDH